MRPFSQVCEEGLLFPTKLKTPENYGQLCFQNGGTLVEIIAEKVFTAEKLC